MLLMASAMRGGLFAQAKEAPASLAAAMITKVAGFEKGVNGAGEVDVYVLSAPEVAAELKKGVGKPIGSATLKTVDAGDGLPASKPSVLYIGDASKLDAAIKYTRANKVLSTTGLPDIVSKGIALGFGVGEDGKPVILLNLSASVEEGLDWNPAIMKVAKTLK
jgi:hypothetical protein